MPRTDTRRAAKDAAAAASAPAATAPIPIPVPAPVSVPGGGPGGLAAFGITQAQQQVADHPERFKVIDIPLEDIAASPFNPEEREALDEDMLSDILPSVRAVGVLTPALVVERKVLIRNSPELDEETDPGVYVMLAGARRRAASTLAGLPTMPAVVRNEFASRRALIQIKFIENLGRLDLTPIAEAETYQQLHETGMSYQQIVDELGGRVKSRGQIAKRIKLLKLTKLGKSLVNNGTVTPDGALALLAQFESDPDSQDRVLTAATSGTPESRIPLKRAIEQETRRLADESAAAAARAQTASMGLQEINPQELWGKDAVLHRVDGEEQVEEARSAGDLAGVTITGGHIDYYRRDVPPGPQTQPDPGTPDTGGPDQASAAKATSVDPDDTPERRQLRQDHLDASRARKDACRDLVRNFGQFRDSRRAVLIEILTDAILAVDVAKAALKMKDPGEWAEVSVATDYDLGQILSDSAAQPLALAVALAAFEKEAADTRYVGSRPWPPAIQRHIRRLVSLGSHTLSPYEEAKLDGI